MEHYIWLIIIILFSLLFACFALYFTAYAVIAVINLYYHLFTGKNLTIYGRMQDNFNHFFD